MTTVEQTRSDLAESELFDWRFTALTRAGYAHADAWLLAAAKDVDLRAAESRSEERRVGKECRSRWAAYAQKKKQRERKSVTDTIESILVGSRRNRYGADKQKMIRTR